jgi:hypothetical protein
MCSHAAVLDVMLPLAWLLTRCLIWPQLALGS